MRGRFARAGDHLKKAWRDIWGLPEGAGGVGGDFNAAQFNRLFMDWVVGNSTPDDEFRRSGPILRRRARDLARNASFIRHFENLLSGQVIGSTGMTLQAKVRRADGELDEAINETIEDAWCRWADNPVSVDRRYPLVQYEQMLLTSMARDGEALNRSITGFKGNEFQFGLQPIDADLLDESYNLGRGEGGNEVRLGVEVDEWSAPTGYWLWNYPMSQSTAGRERKRHAAEDIDHLFIPRRIGQTRGITWYYAAMVSTQMLYRYMEAELVASRAAAAKMGFIQTKDGVDPDLKSKLEFGEASPGVITQLPAGWEFESWTPDHPTNAFQNMVKTIQRDIATGLGAAYSSMSNDYESVNFSSGRLALQAERDMWRLLQRFWIVAFRQPIYRRWLNAALLSGQLKLPSRDWRDYTACNWQPRGWGHIQPREESQANVLELQCGTTSRTRIAADRGAEWADILEELAREDQLAKRAGVSIAPAAAASEDEETNDAKAKKDAGKDANDDRARLALA